ncbi:MAG: SUMF1/EgtB/PvdO family nonheme iron enzyme [Acidobacteriaceae bacterium]|nr:SUMF1/EgtB/PvdO family nonheme iron enzyme [Acidobacteriaceae bacterium]
MSISLSQLDRSSPTSAAERLAAARAQTDALFSVLLPEALYVRPIAERHRLIFYLGHLEAFDWNLIGRETLGAPPLDAAFDKLFAFGIDPEPGQLPSDEPHDWPSVEHVLDYSREVRRVVDGLLPDVAEQIRQVAIEHRLMHAETLAYLFHGLPYELKQRVENKPVRATFRPAKEMIRIPAGTATLGQDPEQFGWDNEFAQHRVNVPAFKVSRHKVTNGDYLRLVESGLGAPHFWTKQGGNWMLRCMFETIPLPLEWPVYVTQAEAKAYAARCGKSLLTEAQFHRAAYGTREGTERSFPWGEDEPTSAHGNFNFARWDPVSVTAHPAGDSAFGVSQMVGNGWEWTSTPFAPFAGFEPFAFYPGYSANFFDNAHFVLKGASPQTAETFLRRSFRNWFRSNYPYVYAGFRLVEN